MERRQELKPLKDCKYILKSRAFFSVIPIVIVHRNQSATIDALEEEWKIKGTSQKTTTTLSLDHKLQEQKITIVLSRVASNQ